MMTQLTLIYPTIQLFRRLKRQIFIQEQDRTLRESGQFLQMINPTLANAPQIPVGLRLASLE